MIVYKTIMFMHIAKRIERNTFRIINKSAMSENVNCLYVIINEFLHCVWLLAGAMNDAYRMQMQTTYSRLRDAKPATNAFYAMHIMTMDFPSFLLCENVLRLIMDVN